MDFLDDAVNKTKEAFDIACKKTGEIVNTQKQRFDASALENKRAKDFQALGELYYEKVKDAQDNEPDVARLVEVITEKTKILEQLYADILRAKNRRRCHKCGASIESVSVFCNVCGERVTFDG